MPTGSRDLHSSDPAIPSRVADNFGVSHQLYFRPHRLANDDRSMASGPPGLILGKGMSFRGIILYRRLQTPPPQCMPRYGNGLS